MTREAVEGELETDGEDPRRIASRKNIIGALQSRGALTRAEIAAVTALSRATVSSVVAELERNGIVAVPVRLTS